MSTHNIFSWSNKKNTNTLGLKKASYQGYLSVNDPKKTRNVVVKHYATNYMLVHRKCQSVKSSQTRTKSIHFFNG